LQKTRKGDKILVAEVSRLGGSPLQVLEILEEAAKKENAVHIVKSRLIMNGSLQSTIIATVLGLSAQIEREFISIRTKEALATRKAEGVKLGRPKDHAKNLKLPPALIYRDAVRQLCINYTPAVDKDPEEDFYLYLDSLYQQYHATFDAESETDRNALFFLAAGLLSFGKIDVAEDLIDYLPPGRAGIRQLALALVALFPVPEHFDPLQDPEPIKKWLRQNRDQLDWNPVEGQFVWRDKPSPSG
jgi:hypothetical protein